jgi:hypothetical protein
MAKENMKMGTGKGGQVTLFIIVGIMIVSAILIFFLWIKPTYLVNRGANMGFEGCVQDATERGILELGPKAGFANPEFTYMYMDEEIPYLCYINEYYKTCVVQKPFLKQHFEEQSKGLLKEDIETCYTNSVDTLRSQGYDVVSGKIDYNISIEPGVVMVEVSAPTAVGSQRFTKFNVIVNSPIYEMLMISTSILQQESHYGDSDLTSITALYPDYTIDKVKRGDGTTIYIMKDKQTETKFQFASRSLAWPAGYS